MRTPVTDDGTPYDFESFCMACAEPGQRFSTRVDILLNGEVISPDGGYRADGGSVTADRRASLYGRISGLTIPEPTLVPTVNGGVLSPAGYEVRVWRGLVIDGTPVRCSLGVYGIETSSVDGRTGVTTLDGWDRSKRVSDFTLIDNVNWASGGSLEIYIAALLFRALPYVGSQVLYSFDGVGHVTQLVTHERDSDPWQIIQQAASSIGYETFFDGEGVFRWRPEPDLRSADPVCDIVERSPEHPRGVLLQLDPSYSRSNSYNYWVVIGDSANDSAEIVGTAIDDDPNSLTYYYGNFGPKPAPVYRSKSVASTLDAQAAANALKVANLGIARTVDFGLIPNPALEPGDAVRLKRDKALIDETMLIDSTTIGLSPSDPMRGQVRARQELS